MTPNGPAFKVIVSQFLLNRIDELHDQAVEAGLDDQFITALQIIQNRLAKDPFNFGEPLYRLPALKLLICVRPVYPLAVDFGIHEDKPLVIIRGVHWIG